MISSNGVQVKKEKDKSIVRAHVLHKTLNLDRLENLSSDDDIYVGNFAIIATRSNVRKRRTTQLRKGLKNFPSCAQVLRKTLNLVNSRCCFAEDNREMCQNLKRT